MVRRSNLAPIAHHVPLKRIGILGGGQLGRMLALAGYPLGLEFQIYSPEKDPCAAQVAPQIRGIYTDRPSLKILAQKVDVVTYEFENVPVEAARYLQEIKPVYPPPEALEVAQDRLNEKKLFQSLKIDTPEFKAISSYDELKQAVKEMGLPCVLKTRRMGYDGKGQYVIRSKKNIEGAWKKLGNSAALILEQFISFDREVSLLAVRSTKGETKFYPLVTNVHEGGILRKSSVGAIQELPLQRIAEHTVRKILDKLNYVGVLAVEFFVKGGKLIANEMAPRVHNSGHWTIEGAETSQFENHLRAILGLPLGSTKARGRVEMKNIIGKIPSTKKNLGQPDTHLHLYGKSEAPGRKLGHVTIIFS